jgi:hypothetical protein
MCWYDKSVKCVCIYLIHTLEYMFWVPCSCGCGLPIYRTLKFNHLLFFAVRTLFIYLLLFLNHAGVKVAQQPRTAARASSTTGNIVFRLICMDRLVRFLYRMREVWLFCIFSYTLNLYYTQIRLFIYLLFLVVRMRCFLIP